MIDDTLVRRMEHEQKTQENPNYMFCKSLVPKLNSLTPEQQEEAQIEILQILRHIRAGPAPLSLSRIPSTSSLNSSHSYQQQQPIQTPPIQTHTPMPNYETNMYGQTFYNIWILSMWRII